MSHIHTVVDADAHYKIDGITRTVVNVDETKRELVQGDHNSERLTFEIPRYVDGHDFSECNAVQVHYENTDTYEMNTSSDVYNVDDLHIKSDDENIVVLSWLISGNATKYVGSLNFVIRFACITDGQVDYAWNTTVFKGISILEGIYNSDQTVAKNSDVIADLTARVKAIEDGTAGITGTCVVDKTLTQPDHAADAAIVGERIDELSDEIASRVVVHWDELNSLSEEDRMIVLEAAQPVWEESIQSIFDNMTDGITAEIFVSGVAYTVRKLGGVHDSFIVRDGVLQLCHKVNEEGTELRTECVYETVAVSSYQDIITKVILPCSVENLLAYNVFEVSYSACGAYLDGIHDDYEAIYRAHFIGDLCKCNVVQHGGTIYKANSGWIHIKNHNVDLSGSVLKLDSYNRYGFYWLSAVSIWTLQEDVVAALRPQMTEYSTFWGAVETGFPTNGLFVVRHPNAIVRWNNGEQTTEDRVEIVRHGADGNVYSTVIDTVPDDAEVTFHRYPETQITFKGCTLNIDINMASVALYFMRCERSNAIIRDFIINPTRRTTMNIGYRGAVFSLNECADITMENIKGINIAGKPRDEYPRGVAGYILNAISVLNLVVRNCNLLGYWGCVGLNGAKEITFSGCELNRVDIHDYFRNLTIDSCRIYGQTINFGYGKGVVNVTNCSVLTNWVHQIVNLRCDYGRYFEGIINIANVDAVYTGPTYFDIVSGITMFSAESAANTGLFMKRYPTINVINVTMHVMNESYAGYIFHMHPDTEDIIEVTDKRKVIEYSNITIYDENGDLQTIGVCSLSGVVKDDAANLEELAAKLTDINNKVAALQSTDTTHEQTMTGFSEELNDYSLRLKALEDNIGAQSTSCLYYSKRTLAYAGANTNIRLTLPYEDTVAIYKAKIRMIEGNDVNVTVTDWTTSYIASDGEEVYIKMPSGAMSSGKVVIFSVYPGTNSGSYEIIVERSAETDAYTGEIQVDFAAVAS